MNLKDVNVFLMVTQTQSLTQAAKRLNTTPMTVSRRLALLEDELGQRLLHRTTRAVALTAEGEEFLPYARAMLEAERGALNLLSPQKSGAAGNLRLTAPSGFARRTIMPLLPALLANNPELNVDLQFSDDIIDIVGQGFDIAIRIAPLRDSRLVARKLADNPRVLCASPDYIKQHGKPTQLAALSEHSCLRLSSVLQWTFITDGQPTSISVEGRFSSSNVEGVRALCMAGMGLAQLTAWDVREELINGELIAISLDDVQDQMLAVWALFPTSRHLPVRVITFLDVLKQAMQSINMSGAT